MFRSFTKPYSSGVPQRFSHPSRDLKSAPSEAATEEISLDHPITVSKYRSLRAFVSAVKQGCSPQGGADEANTSLRLVSFLEETQRRTWLNMKAVLSECGVPLLDDYPSLISWTLMYSALLAASENLHWPMPVDYAAASPEHRTAFESAFCSLLDFQAM